MKTLLPAWLVTCLFTAFAHATTITMVPIFEPLGLHGTDGDEVIAETGEALQATVMPRPMALTGAFPEVLVESIRSPHKIPTNNPNYKVTEANLLVLCRIGLDAALSENGLRVRLDVSNLSIPQDVDLTSRQVLKLAIVAVRKTLEDYQKLQTSDLHVALEIEGADEGKAPLRDLSAKFVVAAGAENG
jgi:hypothetical protein